MTSEAPPTPVLHELDVLLNDLERMVSRTNNADPRILDIFIKLREVAAAAALATPSRTPSSTPSPSPATHSADDTRGESLNKDDGGCETTGNGLALPLGGRASSPAPLEQEDAKRQSQCSNWAPSKHQRLESSDQTPSPADSALDTDVDSTDPVYNFAATSVTSDDEAETVLLKPKRGKSVPDFGEERFAKLSVLTRTRLQPDMPIILRKTWLLFRSLDNTISEKPQIGESDSLVKQLCSQLVEHEQQMCGYKAQELLATMRMRYTATRLAEIYEVKRQRFEEELDKRAKQSKRKKEPGMRKRLQRDEALDEITREWHSLPPSYKFSPRDSRKSAVQYWIEIGRPMLGMVRRLGEGAYIAPGLLLTQPDLKRLRLHQSEDLCDYVDRCYGGLKVQLHDVSPIVKNFLSMGSLGCFRVNIQFVGNEDELLRSHNISLSYWMKLSPFIEALGPANQPDLFEGTPGNPQHTMLPLDPGKSLMDQPVSEDRPQPVHPYPVDPHLTEAHVVQADPSNPLLNMGQVLRGWDDPEPEFSFTGLNISQTGEKQPEEETYDDPLLNSGS